MTVNLEQPDELETPKSRESIVNDAHKNIKSKAKNLI